jgi:hypothetical protein
MNILCAIWRIPEGFATLVAGFFVIVAAGIAWRGVQRQIRVTQQIEATKIRLDLYNRRFQIFVSIFDFYEALIGWKGSEEQRLMRARFFRAYQESVFLFKPESGIEEMLKSLFDASGKITGLKEESEQLKAGGPKFYLEQFNAMNGALEYFGNTLPKLRAAFGDYLSFHTIASSRD